MQNGQVCLWMRLQDNQRPPVATKVRIVADKGFTSAPGQWGSGTYPPAECQVEIEVLESGERATVAASELFDCKSND